MRSPFYCSRHFQATVALAQSPRHHVEWSKGGQEHSHTNLQTDLGPHTQTGAGSCLLAIMHVKPPPCPGSERCGTTPGFPDVYSECMPEGPPELCLLTRVQTRCPRILHFKSPCCEYKPGIPLPGPTPNPSTEPQPSRALHTRSDRGISWYTLHTWPRADHPVQPGGPSHRSQDHAASVATT